MHQPIPIRECEFIGCRNRIDFFKVDLNQYVCSSHSIDEYNCKECGNHIATLSQSDYPKDVGGQLKLITCDKCWNSKMRLMGI